MKLEPTFSVRPPRPKDKDEEDLSSSSQGDLMKFFTDKPTIEKDDNQSENSQGRLYK